ncbi:low temperature requirement protein A [Streptococcus dentasini]
MSKIIAKRVSNYELFYDLVFVLAVSRLISFLHTNSFDGDSMISFLVSSSLLMSIWMYQTIYLNKYGERDRLDVYLNIPAMFIAGNFGLMLGLNHYGTREYLLYNSLLILAHGLIAFQYYLRGRKIGFNADMIASMKRLGLILFYFTALILAATVFHLFKTSDANFFLLWLVPWIFPFLFSQEVEIGRLNFPHLVERFQLITIITFGETVVGLIQTYPLYKSPVLGILFFTGISFMFVAYISQTFLTINHHQETRGLVLIYTHLAIIIAINMVTGGIESLADSHHTDYGLMLLSLGLLIFYPALYATSIYNRRLYRFARNNYLPYIGVVILGIIAMWILRHYNIGIALILAATCFIIPRLNFHARRRAREKHKQD